VHQHPSSIVTLQGITKPSRLNHGVSAIDIPQPSSVALEHTLCQFPRWPYTESVLTMPAKQALRGRSGERCVMDSWRWEKRTKEMASVVGPAAVYFYRSIQDEY
jgi:hypothetical protein